MTGTADLSRGAPLPGLPTPSMPPGGCGCGQDGIAGRLRIRFVPRWFLLNKVLLTCVILKNNDVESFEDLIILTKAQSSS